MVFGQENGSMDNGGFHTGVITPHGLFGNGGEFDGKTQIQLQPVDFDGEKVETWKISFWWKPKELKKQRFMTITNGEESECTGVDCNKFIIDFVPKNKEGMVTETVKLELKMFGEHYECFSPNPITLNEWNKISIEFDMGRVVFGINGIKEEMEGASEGQSTEGASEDGSTDAEKGLGATNVGVVFDNWSIGALKDGLTGTIDKVEVTNLHPRSQPNTTEPMWVRLVIGSVLGLIACFCLCAFCSCYGLCCCVACNFGKASNDDVELEIEDEKTNSV